MNQLDRIRAFLREHLAEMTNEHGGVIGYTLQLDASETQALWRLCDTAEARDNDRYEEARSDAREDARLEREEE